MFFIFGKINQQNVFGVILESQKAFFKKGPFSKGAAVGPLAKKLKFFPCFYFWQNQPAKCIWR